MIVFKKNRQSIEYVTLMLSYRLSGRGQPTTLFVGEGILSIRLHRQSILDGTHYSWTIKTFSSVHFTTVHANLIEQTTSSIELVVLKRRIIVVIRKDSRFLLLHRLEQHRRILLSKETYRTLAHPADPCINHFGDMIWKIPNPTLRSNLSKRSKKHSNRKTPSSQLLSSPNVALEPVSPLNRAKPPKNGLIALWSATNSWYVVKCVSQKRNWSNNKNQWYNIF